MRTINMFKKSTRFEKITFHFLQDIFTVIISIICLIMAFTLKIYNLNILTGLFGVLAVIFFINSFKELNMFDRVMVFEETKISIYSHKNGCRYSNKVKLQYEVNKESITDIRIIEALFPLTHGGGLHKDNLICITLNGAEPLKDGDEYMSYYKDRNYIFIQVREEIKDIVKEELDIDISEYLQKDKKKHWYEN